ncbi:MAG: geranylgeranylglycerol-phosphate geranylgeranyltransferase [Bacteroidota bacterium]
MPTNSVLSTGSKPVGTYPELSSGKLRLLRGLAFLGLIRWYNLATVALAQLLAAGFLLDQYSALGWRFLIDRELWQIVGGTALMLAGGYLLNAFYDLEKDMANHPVKVIMGRVIRPSQALQAWIALSMLTVVVIWPLGWRFLAYYALYGGGLWLYSHKLKRIPLLGNASAILLLMAAFMALVLYYRDANIPTLVFVFYVGILEWIRGLVKDCQNVRGDAIYGYRTVPVVLGLRKTRNLLLLSPLGFVPPLLWLTLFGKVHPYFPYLLVIQLITVFNALALLWKSMNPKRLHTAQRLLKMVLLSAIGGLMLW